MRDEDKSRSDLIAELVELRTMVDDKAQSENKHEQVKLGGIDVQNVLHNLIEHMPSFVYIKDLEGRFVLASNTVARAMGGSSSLDLIGKTDYDFYPEDLAKEFQEDEQDVIRTGIPLDCKDEPLTMRDGTKLWVLTTKIPLRDARGETSGIIGIGQNISRSKYLEAERDEVIAELKDAMERIKTLKGLLPICSWCKKIRDDDGYWHKVEVFVADRSGADFTHGVCPDCVKKFQEKQVELPEDEMPRDKEV